ncbi:MAG: hypothetical protein ACFBSE_09465 [Prochloraceae cyanobacterium]
MIFNVTETENIVDRATESTGKTLEAIANNPIIKSLHGVFGMNWLMSLLGEVDIEKALANVNELEAKYPQATAYEIADRIIQNKAIEAGKVGLMTNIIPPVAAFLLGVELAAITKLQAEMIYEIAAAHGLDLKDPSRRGEVVGIFALSLGGNMLKGGLNLIEILPGIGAIVGASSNALLFYALGQTACGFYEEKSQLIKEAESEDKDEWKYAYTQSKIVDLALIHTIKASYGDRPWSEILPVLREVSPSSVKTIAVNIKKPRPLELLLKQLSPSYARILLQRSYAIALWEDGSISAEEQSVINAILEQFPHLMER